jgi:Flp pilus assembly protein TadG
MSQASGKTRTGQRGSAMIEVALVLALFLMLIFGCVQFAIVFFVYSNTVYASQVAVRYAIMHGTVSGNACTNATRTGVIMPLLWGTQANSVTVTTAWSPDNSIGSTVTIKVAVLYKTRIPFSLLSSFSMGTSAQGTILY